MSDRALQDRLIRALADAPFRDSADWRSAQLADTERVERFAHFLARRFYYERIVHFFKYSRALARVTGRHPETVLRQATFDALLPAVVLGSRVTARAVADLVVAYTRAGERSIPVPSHDELLRYESTMMVVEAGSRVWSDLGTGDVGRGTGTPEKVEGTVLLELAYDLPAVLPELLKPWTAVPQTPLQPTKLLVARSPHGRVTVARSDDAVAAVVKLADGTRTLAQLAAEARLDVAALEQTLHGLVDLGAVRFATGS